MKEELSPLEAVKCLKEQFEICGIKNNPYLKIIETALNDYEKKTKLAKDYKDVNKVAQRLLAFETIKDKSVDTILIKNSKDYEDYCELFATKVLVLRDDHLSFSKNKKGITKQEYRFMKEVFK